MKNHEIKVHTEQRAVGDRYEITIWNHNQGSTLPVEFVDRDRAERVASLLSDTFKPEFERMDEERAQLPRTVRRHRGRES